jgi:hypothetical protein
MANKRLVTTQKARRNFCITARCYGFAVYQAVYCRSGRFSGFTTEALAIFPATSAIGLCYSSSGASLTENINTIAVLCALALPACGDTLSCHSYAQGGCFWIEAFRSRFIRPFRSAICLVVESFTIHLDKNTLNAHPLLSYCVCQNGTLQEN